MKAIIQDRCGSADVLELSDIDEPVVDDGDVPLRVHAASVHIGCRPDGDPSVNVPRYTAGMVAVMTGGWY